MDDLAQRRNLSLKHPLTICKALLYFQIGMINKGQQLLKDYENGDEKDPQCRLNRAYVFYVKQSYSNCISELLSLLFQPQSTGTASQLLVDSNAVADTEVVGYSPKSEQQQQQEQSKLNIPTNNEDGRELTGIIKVPAVNLLSICYLFTKQVNKAMEALENLIKFDMDLVDEVVVGNLFLLYDFTGNETRKKFIKSILAKYRGDDFNIFA